MSPAAAPLPLLIDTDLALPLPVRDVDDAMALAAALASPEVELRCVTACAGNCRALQAAANARRLLDLAGRPDVVVGLGPEEPLHGSRRAHHRYLEAKAAGPEARFWAGLDAPPEPSRRHGFPDAPELMVQESRRNGGRVAFLLLGSLTNLALALRLCPELAGQSQGAWHMGGVLDDGRFAWTTPDIPDAVWRDVLRFNTLYDPWASLEVIERGPPLTFIPANVTVRTLQRAADLDRLAAANDPRRRLLVEGGRAWLAWSRAARGLAGAHMHDPTALAAVLAPELFRFEETVVDRGRLLAGDARFLRPQGDGPRVRTAVDVDARAVEAFLAERLA